MLRTSSHHATSAAASPPPQRQGGRRTTTFVVMPPPLTHGGRGGSVGRRGGAVRSQSSGNRLPPCSALLCLALLITIVTITVSPGGIGGGFNRRRAWNRLGWYDRPPPASEGAPQDDGDLDVEDDRESRRRRRVAEVCVDITPSPMIHPAAAEEEDGGGGGRNATPGGFVTRVAVVALPAASEEDDALREGGSAEEEQEEAGHRRGCDDGVVAVLMDDDDDDRTEAALEDANFLFGAAAEGGNTNCDATSDDDLADAPVSVLHSYLDSIDAESTWPPSSTFSATTSADHAVRCLLSPLVLAAVALRQSLAIPAALARHIHTTRRTSRTYTNGEEDEFVAATSSPVPPFLALTSAMGRFPLANVRVTPIHPAPAAIPTLHDGDGIASALSNSTATMAVLQREATRRDHTGHLRLGRCSLTDAPPISTHSSPSPFCLPLRRNPTGRPMATGGNDTLRRASEEEEAPHAAAAATTRLTVARVDDRWGVACHYARRRMRLPGVERKETGAAAARSIDRLTPSQQQWLLAELPLAHVDWAVHVLLARRVVVVLRGPPRWGDRNFGTTNAKTPPRPSAGAQMTSWANATCRRLIGRAKANAIAWQASLTLLHAAVTARLENRTRRVPGPDGLVSRQKKTRQTSEESSSTASEGGKPPKAEPLDYCGIIGGVLAAAMDPSGARGVEIAITATDFPSGTHLEPFRIAQLRAAALATRQGEGHPRGVFAISTSVFPFTGAAAICRAMRSTSSGNVSVGRNHTRITVGGVVPKTQVVSGLPLADASTGAVLIRSWQPFAVASGGTAASPRDRSASRGIPASEGNRSTSSWATRSPLFSASSSGATPSRETLVDSDGGGVQVVLQPDTWGGRNVLLTLAAREAARGVEEDDDDDKEDAVVGDDAVTPFVVPLALIWPSSLTEWIAHAPHRRGGGAYVNNGTSSSPPRPTQAPAPTAAVRQRHVGGRESPAHSSRLSRLDQATAFEAQLRWMGAASFCDNHSSFLPTPQPAAVVDSRRGGRLVVLPAARFMIGVETLIVAYRGLLSAVSHAESALQEFDTYAVTQQGSFTEVQLGSFDQLRAALDLAIARLVTIAVRGVYGDEWLAEVLARLLGLVVADIGRVAGSAPPEAATTTHSRRRHDALRAAFVGDNLFSRLSAEDLKQRRPSAAMIEQEGLARFRHHVSLRPMSVYRLVRLLAKGPMSSALAAMDDMGATEATALPRRGWASSCPLPLDELRPWFDVRPLGDREVSRKCDVHFNSADPATEEADRRQRAAGPPAVTEARGDEARRHRRDALHPAAANHPEESLSEIMGGAATLLRDVGLQLVQLRKNHGVGFDVSEAVGEGHRDTSSAAPSSPLSPPFLLHMRLLACSGTTMPDAMSPFTESLRSRLCAASEIESAAGAGGAQNASAPFPSGAEVPPVICDADFSTSTEAARSKSRAESLEAISNDLKRALESRSRLEAAQEALHLDLRRGNRLQAQRVESTQAGEKLFRRRKKGAPPQNERDESVRRLLSVESPHTAAVGSLSRQRQALRQSIADFQASDRRKRGAPVRPSRASGGDTPRRDAGDVPLYNYNEAVDDAYRDQTFEVNRMAAVAADAERNFTRDLSLEAARYKRHLDVRCEALMRAFARVVSQCQQGRGREAVRRHLPEDPSDERNGGDADPTAAGDMTAEASSSSGAASTFATWRLLVAWSLHGSSRTAPDALHSNRVRRIRVARDAWITPLAMYGKYLSEAVVAMELAGRVRGTTGRMRPLDDNDEPSTNAAARRKDLAAADDDTWIWPTSLPDPAERRKRRSMLLRNAFASIGRLLSRVYRAIFGGGSRDAGEPGGGEGREDDDGMAAVVEPTLAEASFHGNQGEVKFASDGVDDAQQAAFYRAVVAAAKPPTDLEYDASTWPSLLSVVRPLLQSPSAPPPPSDGSPTTQGPLRIAAAATEAATRRRRAAAFTRMLGMLLGAKSEERAPSVLAAVAEDAQSGRRGRMGPDSAAFRFIDRVPPHRRGALLVAGGGGGVTLPSPHRGTGDRPSEPLPAPSAIVTLPAVEPPPLKLREARDDLALQTALRNEGAEWDGFLDGDKGMAKAAGESYDAEVGRRSSPSHPGTADERSAKTRHNPTAPVGVSVLPGVVLLPRLHSPFPAGGSSTATPSHRVSLVPLSTLQSGLDRVVESAIRSAVSGPTGGNTSVEVAMGSPSDRTRLSPTSGDKVWTRWLATQRLGLLPSSHDRNERDIIGVPALPASSSSGSMDPPPPPSESSHVVLTWAGYCCHCCGFSNEISELLRSLEEVSTQPRRRHGRDEAAGDGTPFRLSLQTSLAPTCHCRGLPPHLALMIDRLFVERGSASLPPLEDRHQRQSRLIISARPRRCGDHHRRHAATPVVAAAHSSTAEGMSRRNESGSSASGSSCGELTGRGDGIVPVQVWVYHTDPSTANSLRWPENQCDYAVLRAMFEFTRIPASWTAVLNSDAYAEIWVPATFVRDSFAASGVNRSKLIVVPEPIDTHRWRPLPTTLHHVSSSSLASTSGRWSAAARRSTTLSLPCSEALFEAAYSPSRASGSPTASRAVSPLATWRFASSAQRNLQSSSEAILAFTPLRRRSPFYNASQLAGMFPFLRVPQTLLPPPLLVENRSETQNGRVGRSPAAAASPTHRRRPFRFLSVFKWEDRKGHDVLFDAFFRAFATCRGDTNGGRGGRPDHPPDGRRIHGGPHHPFGAVSLYVATFRFLLREGQSDARSPVGYLDDLRARFARLAREHDDRQLLGLANATTFIQAPNTKNAMATCRWPHFEIITEELSEEDMVALYRSVDAFVLPTRGEGWGLPVIQAMSMALPTAATNFSGITDFLDPASTFPIGVERLETVPTWAGNGGKDPWMSWAVPSLDHLVHTMRYLADPKNRVAIEQRGRKARAFVEARYSPAAIGTLLRDQLQRIETTVRSPPQQRQRPSSSTALHPRKSQRPG